MRPEQLPCIHENDFEFASLPARDADCEPVDDGRAVADSYMLQNNDRLYR